MARKGVHKYRSQRIDYEEKQDPDIQREIDKHGSDNVQQRKNLDSRTS